MSGISDRALKPGYAENRYRYNGGSELQNKEFSDGSGLETYDANFRMYDPQLGRFMQIDPLSDVNENYSPYAFANNNPILFNDPLGMDTARYGDPAYVTAAKKTTPAKPDVAAAAGPAPTRVAPPIQSEEEKEKHAAIAEFIGHDIYDFQYQQNQVVVRQPTFWENLTDDGDGGKLIGYNFRGGAVRTPLTILTPNPWLMPDGPPGEAAATIFKNISVTRKSITNFLVGMSKVRFEAALAKAAGKAWETTADGKAKTLFFNGLKYVSRLSTTGEETIDIYRDGQLLQKYRLQ